MGHHPSLGRRRSATRHCRPSMRVLGFQRLKSSRSRVQDMTYIGSAWVLDRFVSCQARGGGWRVQSISTLASQSVTCAGIGTSPLLQRPITSPVPPNCCPAAYCDHPISLIPRANCSGVMVPDRCPSGVDWHSGIPFGQLHSRLKTVLYRSRLPLRANPSKVADRLAIPRGRRFDYE